MNTTNYPYRDALRDALDIYLNSMSDFIVKSLRQSQKQTREEIIRQYCRKDTLECKDIANIIRNKSSWHHFEMHFKYVDEYYEARSVVGLIVEGRNRAYHPPWDLDPEFTQTQLFIIGEILSKINRPSEQREVKKIREDLFYDDTKDFLAEAEKRIKILESEKQEYERSNAVLSECIAEKDKRLQDAASEKQEYEESNAELSQQLIDNALRIENISEELKEAEVEKTNYKKDLTKTREELEKKKTLNINYTDRLESLEKEIKDTKAELHATKKNLTEASSQLTTEKAEKKDYKANLISVEKQLAEIKTEKKSTEIHLTTMQNVFNMAIIDNQMVEPIFPPLSRNSLVRILDHRKTDTENYLLNLLKLKKPTLIYVQDEQKMNQFFNRVEPDLKEMIGKHNDATAEAEEKKLVERLEKGKLIAIVSNDILSTLTPEHCVEHFAFCHLSPGSDMFIKRYGTAFIAYQNAFLHLIYDSEKDIKLLHHLYPDRKSLEKIYRLFKKNIEMNENFVNAKTIHKKLGVEEPKFKACCSILEELGLLERNEIGIRNLPSQGKKLEESKLYCKGQKIKQGIEEFFDFQNKLTVEQIWGQIVENIPSVSDNNNTPEITKSSEIADKLAQTHIDES